VKTVAARLLELRHPGRPSSLAIMLGFIACLSLLATSTIGTRLRVERATSQPAVDASAVPIPHRVSATAAAPPSAAEFTQILAGTGNAYASAHGERTRIGRVHCVSPSAGKYMCSYVTKAPGARAQCHIVQARWTPDDLDSFAVTLSGRAARCATLRQAIRSLK
jgi:hypothetical protein